MCKLYPVPYRRARASRPAAGYAASAFGGSEDGRTSLYGDGLVRLWMDGSPARGANPCSPTVSQSSLERPWIFGAAGLLLVGLGLVAGCGKKPPDGVALVGATLIDGTGGPPLANAAIVVRRGKIEWMGTRTGFQLPPRTTQI